MCLVLVGRHTYGSAHIGTKSSCVPHSIHPQRQRQRRRRRRQRLGRQQKETEIETAVDPLPRVDQINHRKTSRQSI